MKTVFAGVGPARNPLAGTLLAALMTIVSTSTVPAQSGPDYALSMNGVNAALVSGSSTFLPSSSDAYTIEVWIRPSTMANGTLVAWGAYGQTNAWNALQLRTNGIANSWFGNDVLGVTTNLSTAWHHVAAVCDGAWRILYLDGNPLASNSVSGVLHEVPFVNNASIGSAGGSNFYGGLIDEVRIWNQARDQNRIRTNRFVRLTGSETGLKAYWKLSEGTGTQVADTASGGFHNASFVGSPAWVRSTAPSVPEAVTLPAPNVTTASGRLNARVHPGNLASKFWFQWGTTTNYGNNTPQVTIGPDLPLDPAALAHPVASTITNLALNTAYYYRAAVTNIVGTNYGSTFSFTTDNLPLGSDNALTFDGVDDYVVFNRPVSNDFTIECWFRSSQRAGSGDGHWYQGAGLVDGEVNSVVPDFGVTLGGGRVLFGTGGDYTIRSEELADGQWHHVAATRQLSGGAMRLYIDGQLTASANGSTLVLNAPPQMRLGSLATGLNFFQGQIDEVRLWNVVRTDVQIQGNLRRPLAGNEPGLVAYFRLDETFGSTVVDATGHEYDGILVNGPARSPSTLHFGPEVATLPATNLTTTTANLKGAVNPQGFNTLAWFEWGTTTAYGNTTARTNAGSSATTVALSTNIGGLTWPNTYHYRAVASNSFGTIHGLDQIFWLGLPQTETLAATDIITNAATLRGRAVPGGPSGSAWFEWGLTTNYGSASPAQPLPAGSLPSELSFRLTPLTPGATYHYHLIATNTFGRTMATDSTFTTPFFAQMASSLPGTDWSSTAWGDYDSDNDLDLLITGINISTPLYRNDGNNIFTAIPVPGYTPLAYGSASWGDYDADGDLDFLAVGQVGSTPTTTLYRQQPLGTFTALAPGLPGLRNAAAAWGDFDNDGDLDIAMCGGTSPTAPDSISAVFRNNGNSTFTGISAGIPGVSAGSIAWGDVDNDGNLDLLLTGTTNGATTGAVSRIYQNRGDGSFVLLPAALPGCCYGTGAFGDFDADGDLDVLLTGMGTSGPRAEVYRNNGDGTFTDLHAGLPGTFLSSAAWGDFDMDGRLDILLVGDLLTGGVETPFGCIYRNQGGGQFEPVPSSGIVPTFKGSVAVADYDKDGRLDIVTSGWPYATRLYKNYWPATNTPPTPPANLVAKVFCTNALLSWSSASDLQTPSPGLAYNLRVGTAPGLQNVVPAHAINPTGWRRVADLGNRFQTLSVTLNDLKHGSNYYWSVQAIDPAFAGSSFAAEGSFTVTRLPAAGAVSVSSISANSAVVRAAIYPNGSPTLAWVQWGTSPSYGHSTTSELMGAAAGPNWLSHTLAGLQPATWYHFRVVTTNSHGTTYSPDQTFYMGSSALAGDTDGNGSISETELEAVLAGYWPTSPWLFMTNVAGLGETNITFSIQALIAGSFTVQGSTNLSSWSDLGIATPRYGFTDTNSPLGSQRYYRLRWP